MRCQRSRCHGNRLRFGSKGFYSDMEQRLAEEPMPKSATKRRGIQSVVTGFSVLNALVSLRGPAPLRTIAAAAAMSTSQAHRYLTSLIAAGMVKQQADNGSYEIAEGPLRLGLAALSQLDLFRAIDAPVQHCVKTTGRTAVVSIWGQYGPTIVRWFAGSPPVLTAVNVGSVLAVTTTATGQVFMTFLPSAETADLVKREASAGHQLRVSIERIRRTVSHNGYSKGLIIPGLRACAAPVFDFQGRLGAVITLLASSFFEERDDDNATKSLLLACREVSETLGATWPYPKSNND